MTTGPVRDVQSSSQIVTTNKPTPNILQAGCPSCRPTNSVKALKGNCRQKTRTDSSDGLPCVVDIGNGPLCLVYMLHSKSVVSIMHKYWGSVIRGLVRGTATLPQGNQELLVVRDKVERPQVSSG